MNTKPFFVQLVIPFCLAFIVCACGGNGDKTESKEKASSNAEVEQSAVENRAKPSEKYDVKKRIIVIFDSSKSIPEQSIRRALNAVKKIANEMDDKSQLVIFTTNKSTVQPPLVNIKKEVPINSRDRRIYQETWNKDIDKITSGIRNHIQEQEEATCLVSAMKSVKNYLNGASSAQQTYPIFISDMLECCDGICIEKKAGIPNSMKKVEKLDLSYYALADLIPASNLYGYQLSQNLEEQYLKVIDTEEFRQFWKTVFQKFGYEAAPDFTTSLDKFIEKI